VTDGCSTRTEAAAELTTTGFKTGWGDLVNERSERAPRDPPGGVQGTPPIQEK